NPVVAREFTAPMWWMRVVAVVGALSLTCSVALAVITHLPRIPFLAAGPLPAYVVGLFAWWRAPHHGVARCMVIVGALFALFFAGLQVGALMLPHGIGTGIPGWQLAATVVWQLPGVA